MNTRRPPAATRRAKSLRGNQTDAEWRLWQALRRRRFAGYKFRRQHPLGNYIVDFVCYEKKLIVEADGGQHAEQTQYDSDRTRWLESQGFKVLRFWNNEILANTESVLEVIHKEIG